MESLGLAKKHFMDHYPHSMSWISSYLSAISILHFILTYLSDFMVDFLIIISSYHQLICYIDYLFPVPLMKGTCFFLPPQFLLDRAVGNLEI